SLTKVLTPVRNLMAGSGDIVCLIKPQFEAGREKVGKKGVVRDPKVHEEVIRAVITYAAGIGLPARALDYSPVKGPEGNIEYLVWLKKEGIVPAEETAENDGNRTPADGISSGCMVIGNSEIMTAPDNDGSVTDREVVRVVAEAHAALD
ncbi:MAG: TlyA family RNA methyltransferase, partial [Lachnospiraceae bacterium]|nr:TlyA family RNA methyltransferase [Lachnospiraceae bacterium]